MIPRNAPLGIPFPACMATTILLPSGCLNTLWLPVWRRSINPNCTSNRTRSRSWSTGNFGILRRPARRGDEDGFKALKTFFFWYQFTIGDHVFDIHCHRLAQIVFDFLQSFAPCMTTRQSGNVPMKGVIPIWINNYPVGKWLHIEKLYQRSTVPVNSVNHSQPNKKPPLS